MELESLDLKTLDDQTPTLRAKMYSLSLQQRKIVDLLSEFEEGLIVKEIAKRCFITEQTASCQLYRLKEDKVVESSSNGRESVYQLLDRNLRDWLRMRGYKRRYFDTYLLHTL
jgi:DNA-binding MarR family transcriptional regulator